MSSTDFSLFIPDFYDKPRKVKPVRPYSDAEKRDLSIRFAHLRIEPFLTPPDVVQLSALAPAGSGQICVQQQISGGTCRLDIAISTNLRYAHDYALILLREIITSKKGPER